MSLYRMLVRMAAVSTVSNYMQAPWPTLAGPNIFDSKIEPAEDHPDDVLYPCVVFYTDYDKDIWSKGGKTQGERLLSLTIELLLVQRDEHETTPNAYQLHCPTTDSELETSLDALELQVFRAFALSNPAGDVLNWLLPTYDSLTSRRGASHEGGQRLAARQITLEAKALRESANGTIPAPVEAYLQSCDVPGYEYQERVAEIRRLFVEPASLTPGELFRRHYGLTAEASIMLGHEPVQRWLPPVINYNYQGLNP